MPSLNRLKKYARLSVISGVNLQKNQALMISANTDTKEFVRLIVEEAYLAGASDVKVRWNDEITSHSNFKYKTKEQLEEIPEYIVKEYDYYIEKGYALIAVHATTPGLLADIDPEKIQVASIAQSKALKHWREHTMGNRTQWCVISVPTLPWALKVFPQQKDNEVVESLWDAILSAVRVQEDNDPVAQWDAHTARLQHNNKTLNDLNFKSLHFSSNLGTDLSVELVNNHIWAGGNEESTQGVIFNANMPTEENFTMPLKTGVNGIVYASKPLNYNGVLVKDFWLKFEAGKVVDYDAREGKDTLKSLIEYDEGSCYLGEVALVNYDSPISNLGILFMNTLFDENASCHLALGRAYPMNIKGGHDMSQDELDQAGSNNSLEHEDFMFGTNDMNIVGTQQDGTQIQVFKDGNFVI